MPFSLMEAMSCGCICVCSNVGDIPYVIEDSSNGFLIRPREPELLADKIEEIMGRSTKELLGIRRRARQTILKKYESTKWTKYMIDIIENETPMSN
jgi:glycosyltransferase involved in cell wall biosynthesis